MARWLVASLLACVVSGCAMDDQYVYYPSPWQDADWARQSGLPLEEVWFQASDGVKLFGWFVEAPGSPAVMIWCHGNAGNISHRLDNIAEWHRRGLSLLIFDYRGYGRSDGRPSEDGLYRDAQAAYQFLTQQRGVPPERLIIFGRSLGAAVAGELAATQPAARLILESPFPSVEAMVKVHYGPLPMHLLLRARFHLLPRLQKVRIPILVVHGDRDSIVPLPLGRQVYDAAPEPKAFYLIPGADHNDTYVVGGEPYFTRLLSFINE